MSMHRISGRPSSGDGNALKKESIAPWPMGLLCPHLQSYKRWDSRYGKKVVPVVSLPLPL